MAGMTRTHPELGEQKFCPVCPTLDPGSDGWWDLDAEFWHRVGSTWADRCKACWAARGNAARYVARGCREPAYTKDGRSKLPGYKQALGRAAYARMTPERRKARTDAIRARRHAASIVRQSLRSAQASAEAAA